MFLGTDDAGDINEGDQRAIYRAVGCAVWQNTHQKVRRPVLPLGPAFPAAECLQSRLNVLPQGRVAHPADDVGSRDDPHRWESGL